MWRNGLRDNTLDVFEQVSRLNCIKDLYLCGGTGISLLLQHRQNEDLDFEMLTIRCCKQASLLMKAWIMP